MIACFSLAIIQLFDKSLKKVLCFSLIISAIIFVIVWSLVGHVLSQLELSSTGWFYGIFDWVFIKITSFFGGVLTLFLTWLIFPSLVTIIITFFLETVIKAVEKKHYPKLTKPRQQSTIEIVRITVKFMILSVILNILVIPIYIIFFFLGPVNLLIFYMLNGYLLGKEYFELVVYRRLEPNKTDEFWKFSRGKIVKAGIISAVLMTIPIINMITPIISVAAMVHLVQKCSKKFNMVKI